MHRLTLPAAALIAAASPVSPLLAQSATAAKHEPPKAAASRPSARADADDDEEQRPSIVVTGTRRAIPDVLGNVSVLDREELAHDLKPSIGDTLADMPGVSATSFGPSSSRPILRGEQGERAPVLVDGISSLDLSASDPDHAVTINPLTAESIEVLHGPSALLFSASTIAGVVNVTDTRIPRSVPSKLKANLLVNTGSAANERSANAGVDVPVSKHIVLHADGAYSKYDDLDIGGYVLAEPLRQQALASPDATVRALADLKGTLPNTAGRSDDAAVGAAYVDGDLNVGLSYAHHDSKYGVPIRFSLDPTVTPEQPVIDAHQDRGDARVNVPVGGFIRVAEFRGGISRYHHDELGPGGAVGTSFYSNGAELRGDLVQADRGGWGGTTGVDYLTQDARIRGDEKYLPDSRKRDLGLFTVQTVERGRLRLEGGLRLDIASMNADADAQIAANGGVIGTMPIKRDLTAASASLGGNYEVVPGWRLGLSLSHSERAPSIQELFSNGAHGGSQQFLVGNPELGLEKSNGAEVSLHRTTGPVHIQGSVYYSRYSNFIFEAPTGIVRDGLPLYEFREGKADYYGFELESDLRFGKALGIDWGGEVTTDAVRARIRDYGNAPEIPPFRILAGLTGRRGTVTGRVEAERVSAQHRIAPEETPTAGYTMVNASLDWTPLADKPALTLSLTANNLFDVDARRHASELKDYAPLAGRDIRLTARLDF